MNKKEDLKELLNRIDHKGYPAYKDTQGIYQFGEYLLDIEHVQGDPFASPSKIKIVVKGENAGFPADLYESNCKRIALQDYIIRYFGKTIEKYSFQAKGSGKSGLMAVSRCGQEIIEKSACQIDVRTGTVTLRMEIGFPANGRTINSKELIKIFFDYLPEAVNRAVIYRNLDKKLLQENAALAQDQAYIRKQLGKMGLVAFIANGSILPRESGVSRKPMRKAVPFCSPKELEVTLELPNHGEIKGMGIRKGITLVVGGGYHGKSTLLEALELGVYNHISGDGREYVITDDTAMKIRAEDGRSIQNVDISMFISNLPNGKDTKKFCTEDASGSTSQAANVVEAMEAGSKVLLIDEDTSATNFMIRDELMQKVVHKDKEPITPYIDKIRELYEEYGISTILVAGSSGAYFTKADCIIQMDTYVPYEITQYAKSEAQRFYSEQQEDKTEVTGYTPDFTRKVKSDKEWMQDRLKLKTSGLDSILINKDCIDMRYVEQLVDPEQLQTLGYILKYAQKNLFDGNKTLQDVVNELSDIINEKGLSYICESRYLPCNLAMPRKQEIFACINRYRKIHF